jgi:hypothetical protein
LILKQIKHIVTLALLLVLALESFGQTQYLSDFNAYIEGEEIYVSWTTKKGFSCENIEVQLGTDSGELETVYTYLGVCGGDLKEENYFYRIPEPIFNADNYIRLDLGLYGFSQIVKLKPHKAIEGTVLVFPLPATNQSTILFANPQQSEAKFKVYSSSGALVSELHGIRAKRIPVAALNLPAGMYFVHLFIDDRSQIFKLVKSH